MIERDQKISRIGHAIQTVNSIFRELGDMVTQQGETLDLIDEKIGDTEDRTGKGLEELEKSNKSSKSARDRYCMFVLLTITVIFVISLIIATYIKA